MGLTNMLTSRRDLMGRGEMGQRWGRLGEEEPGGWGGGRKVGAGGGGTGTHDQRTDHTTEGTEENRGEGLEEIARRDLLQPVGGFPPG